MKKGVKIDLLLERGDHLLHAACVGGCIEIVNFLLERNADKVPFDNLLSPLLQAC